MQRRRFWGNAELARIVLLRVARPSKILARPTLAEPGLPRLVLYMMVIRSSGVQFGL